MVWERYTISYMIMHHLAKPGEKINLLQNKDFKSSDVGART